MTQRARLIWRGDRVPAELRAAAARGLLLGAEHVLAESRLLVPIDEAALSRSGTASVDEQQLLAAVSYDTPYAVRQHEELTWRHAPGRRAKYLEGPFVAEQRVVQELIAAALRRALR